MSKRPSERLGGTPDEVFFGRFGLIWFFSAFAFAVFFFYLGEEGGEETEECEGGEGDRGRGR